MLGLRGEYPWLRHSRAMPWIANILASRKSVLGGPIRKAGAAEAWMLGSSPTIFTHLFFGCPLGVFLTRCQSCFIGYWEARMDRLALGYFGDRRLEKGGSFCTGGWLR